MKSTRELIFSNFLNSLTAVLVPMMVLLFAFIIDASVLFYRALPNDMSVYLKYPASGALGFSIAFPLLLTAVNSELLPAWIKGNKWVGFPMLFALFTVIMTLLFFEIFSVKGKTWDWYFLICFLSLFWDSLITCMHSCFVPSSDRRGVVGTSMRIFQNSKRPTNNSRKPMADSLSPQRNCKRTQSNFRRFENNSPANTVGK